MRRGPVPEGAGEAAALLCRGLLGDETPVTALFADGLRRIAELCPPPESGERGGPDPLAGLPLTEALLDEIESHVTGRPLAPTTNRVLATVLFTDVVESTRHVADLGDRRWSQLLSHHDVIVRAALRAHSGREVATTGDGFLAVFDGPARAIRCAARIRNDLAALDLEMRAGLHAGEVELR